MSSGKWYLYDDSGNLVGPLKTRDLQNRLETNQLDESSRIWDEEEEIWTELGEIPDIEVPEPLELTDDDQSPDDEIAREQPDLSKNPVETKSEKIHCEIHPSRQALGHCINCDRLLCEECVTFKQNGSYCPECSPDDLNRTPEKVPSEFFNRWLYYARQFPAVGITLILIGFVALTLIFGPAVKTSLSDQFGTGDARLYYRQLNRTLYRAQKLNAAGAAGDEQWFLLARSAAKRVLENGKAPDQLKRHALVLLLRIDHRLQRWDDYQANLKLADDLLGPSDLNPDVKFFRALYLLDGESTPAKARQLLEELKRLFTPRSPTIEEPRIPSTIKYPIFGTVHYTRHEVLFHLGRCLRELGNEDEANQHFLKISIDDSDSWWQSRAEELLRQ